jgi:hypothetical protein
MNFGRQAYRDACPFCRGRGCFDCDVKSERAREESFKNALVFKTDSPEDMEKLKDYFHADKLATKEGLARALSLFTKKGQE